MRTEGEHLSILEDYPICLDVVDDLKSYYAFVYDPKKNRTIKRFPQRRELDVTIQNRVRRKGRKPEINAYSVYNESEDCIMITKDLVDRMVNVLLDTEFAQYRRAWMFYVEFFLCTFHELGHLLLGHCQLNKSMTLSAIDVLSADSDIDMNLYQTLEMDADYFAVRRLGEKAATLIKYKSISIFGYDDYEMFYYDTLCGMRAFYYLLTIEEAREAHRQHDISVQTGMPQRGCQPGEQTHMHPPSVARAYNAGLVFMEHLRRCFKIKGEEKRFEEIFFSADQIFGNYELPEEKFRMLYRYVLDGTFSDAAKRMKWYYIADVRKKLKPYSRITMGLII